MYYQRNLVVVGLILLLFLGAAIALVSVKMNATANRMHDSMVEEVGRYRAELIALDFKRTVVLADHIREYLESPGVSEVELQQNLKGWVGLDPKVSRIWYQRGKEHFVCIDTGGVKVPDAVLQTTWRKIIPQFSTQIQGRLYYDGDGVLYWSLCKASEGVSMGLDLSLPDLHTYFARMSPTVKSYAYVVNEAGILMIHPDETQINRNLKEEPEFESFREVIHTGRAKQIAGFSMYLLLPVKRVLYPITVGTEKWVVVVNVPDLVMEDEVKGFRRYTLLIAFLTVVVFGILLAFSQYKWRKEYDRRRKSEQDALQLNLQQLKNQINPHFLFNALNSLSVLIGNEPALAKEFVLRLSKIYRYVLEKRKESLVTVREEVAFLRHYYFLQRVRFGEQLNLEIEEELDREERMIPLMSLELLVENAVKHNEISRQYPLSIRIYRKGEELWVENTYRPRVDSAQDSFGVGFESIREIYTYYSDKQFEVVVEKGKYVCKLPLVSSSYVSD